ncbi:hypothetical protein SAMN05421636_103390 [Pricia antarctica]|uniref:Uncharacterized protein n=2 Tax=Pricia antarctica TaxID=641691 RepID=A0A1G7AI04_9FLAO|nr:hypothetical protein SAMN05421636_103390 [Pricia antarctica]
MWNFVNFVFMKKFFHNAISVLMAFVVLFTTLSFTVDMHYCGDTLVDFSLFQKADDCGMEKATEALNCETPSMVEKSCCSDQQIVREANQDLKTSFDTISFGQQIFVASFFYTFINRFEGFDENTVPFKDYHPPFLEQDVLVLNQVFLI